MPRISSPSDRRAFGRRESLVHAFARVSGRSPEPCIVRNFSDSGALISFDAAFEPPERFRLVIEAKGIDAICDVRRRNGRDIGVQFVDDNEAGLKFLDEPSAVPQAANQVEVAVPRLSEAVNIVSVVSGAEVRRGFGL